MKTTHLTYEEKKKQGIIAALINKVKGYDFLDSKILETEVMGSKPSCMLDNDMIRSD